MSKFLSSFALVCMLLFGISSTGNAQVTEHFSDEVIGANTFTTGGFTFNLTGGRFVVAYFATYGWTGTAQDDYYADNYGNYPGAAGVLGAITSPSSTFKVTDLYVFPGVTGDFVSNAGTVIIRGKLGVATQFTHTIASGSINTSGMVDNGYTYVNLSAYSALSIDQLEFEVTGSLRYLAIDAFKHTSTATAVCGNGVIEGSEQCENPGGVWGACCNSATCQFKPMTDICRTDAGDCDVAETCTGTSDTCPTDAFEPNNTPCASDAQFCTGAETCQTGACTSGGNPCSINFFCDEGVDACINSREVQCDEDNANPANSTDTIANVTITYTTAGGWTAPADCAWSCNTDYTLEGGACINSKQVQCDTTTNPVNSTNTLANVTITYTTAGGWSAPAACAWSCDTDFALEGSTCINEKQVPCDEDNANPVNSTDTIANVTITYTTAGGWTAPVDCAWSCDTDYTLEGGLCINEKQVQCDEDNANPANSTDTIANVTITYTTASGWADPVACAWSCNTGYLLDGTNCIVQNLTDLNTLVGDMVKLTWTDPTDAAAFDHIEITWTPSAPAMPVEIGIGIEEAVFDLAWSVEYTFTVTAVMADGSMSDELTITATPEHGDTYGQMYALTGAGSSTLTSLYKLDPATAAATLVGDTDITGGVSLAINPSNGKAYFISNNTYSLYRIDLTTASVLLIGELGEDIDQNPDAAFSPDGTTLYAWSEDQDDLITIDTVTGIGTYVGDSQYGTWAVGLAFNPAGTMIMKAGNDWTTVDPMTGIATFVGSVSNVPDINGSSTLNNGLDFGPDGLAYAIMRDVGNGTTYLFSIDPATLAATQIGDIDVDRISAVAFVPPFNQWFSGIQQGIPQDKLTGWEVCYTDTYIDGGTPLTNILTGCNKASLMIACRPVGSTNFTLAAWAQRGDVTFDTGNNEDITHNANGLDWYYNGDASWGFLPTGATATKNSCDGGDRTDEFWNDFTDPNRLCWHTGSDAIQEGWRCGTTTNNNYMNESQWERVILQADHCTTDYTLEGGLCINSKEVQCDIDNGNPANSTDTLVNVTITYTNDEGWAAPVDCAWTCDTDYTLEGGLCINEKQVPCDEDNANPVNSTDTIANVTITYTTAEGWTAPVDCAWTCDTDYTLEGGACINEKQVQCDEDNANPANSTDTLANVTITYTTADGWTAPAACAWTCDTDYTLEGGLCINSKEVQCDIDNGNPANSTDTIANVTVTYTTAGGWTLPTDCAWTCNTDYTLEGGLCINEKQVQCDTDNANPANSTDTIANVTITYTTAGGWAAPVDCAWTCDTDYTLEGGFCINEKQVQCDEDNANPVNSTDTIVNVTITYTTAGGWTAPTACAWSCDTDYTLEGGACINEKQVQCDTDNANPANSTDTIANVTITYTTAGGWTAPVDCAWTCDTDHTLEGGLCINEKQVPCDTTTNPVNSTNTLVNVTITYTNDEGWTAPTACAWSCDTDYTLEGGACINEKQVQCDEDNANPVNSTDTIANVTITYTTAEGWTAPVDCAWTCNTDYTLEGGLCINEKQVPCDEDNANPVNSTDTIANVTITYTTAEGWTAPVDCAWTCDDGLFLKDNVVCVECLTSDTCNDGNLCTTDTCDTNNVCVNDNNTDTCDDGNALTENDICGDGACAGTLMTGVCGNAIAVEALPYTTTGTITGRPNALENYGLACVNASQPTGDIVYELTVETGVEYQILVTPTDGGDLALNLIGACGENEACIAAANDGSVGAAEVIVGSVSQNGTLYLTVEGSGTYELTISVVEQPDDDTIVTDDVVTDDITTDTVVTDDIVTDNIIIDEDTVVTDDIVIDDVLPDEITVDDIVTDEIAADEDTVEPDETVDETPTDDDSVKPDADKTDTDAKADKDTAVTDDEQPDEATDETVTDGDELLGDEDTVIVPDSNKPAEAGCGCTVIF